MTLTLTACGEGEGQRPPVNINSSDGSLEKPVEAGIDAPVGAPVDAPVEAAPVDAGADATPDVVQPVDAGSAPMCCWSSDDGGAHGTPCSASGVDCRLDAGFCTINNVLAGPLSPCNLCGNIILDACSDGGIYTAPLSCSNPQAITNGNGDLICLCAGGTTCVYGDSTHCSAECR